MDTTPPGMDAPPPPPPAGSGSELIQPTQPPKEPVLVLVLNLLLLGAVGYFIIGQWQKGVVALVASLVIGIPTCGLGIGAVCIAGAIDGFMQAQCLQQGYPIAQWTFFQDHR